MTASPSTDALWSRLRALSAPDVLALGHQDSTAYGVGWVGEAERSDLKSLAGDYPAVHGWDIGGIGGTTNLDGVPFELMRQRIAQAHDRGGINTVSWHMENYVGGGDSWDTSTAVRRLLPGRSHHEAYLRQLDLAADFFVSLVGADGTSVPLIFRPLHEHTGSWFWWGRKHTTDDDYVELFRFTVNYLRGERELRQLLVAFSPEATTVRDETSYLFRYPGDDVVDVFGLDFYYGRCGAKRLVATAEIAVAIAEARGKVAAITEFGVTDGLSNCLVPVESWFTKRFLEPLKKSPTATKAAFALAWRNAEKCHHFVPYPGHPAASDFEQMCADPMILLESQLASLG